MSAYKFQRAARLNRMTAVFFTVVFHVLLIGGVVYGNEGKLAAYVPEKVKTILGMDQDKVAAEDSPAVVEKP